MKKLLIIPLMLLFACNIFGQSVDLRRKIEVTGTAEQEVTPDIINVSISLQEYMDGRKKIEIDQLENQLEKAVRDAGIAKEDFTISDVSGWNNTYQKKKNPDFLASKQYSIRFHDLNRYNQILSQVDSKGIQSTNITSYDYSKIGQLKNELKLNALLSAKDKATYLLNGIGEKPGRPISITEIDNSNYPQPRIMFKQYNAMSVTSVPAPSDIDITKIKLSFQINAVFEIAN